MDARPIERVTVTTREGPREVDVVRRGAEASDDTAVVPGHFRLPLSNVLGSSHDSPDEYAEERKAMSRRAAGRRLAGGHRHTSASSLGVGLAKLAFDRAMECPIAFERACLFPPEVFEQRHSAL